MGFGFMPRYVYVSVGTVLNVRFIIFTCVHICRLLTGCTSDLNAARPLPLQKLIALQIGV